MTTTDKPIITIKNCNSCPCLWTNTEFPQTICKLTVSLKLNNGHLWFGSYERGPAPKTCPLRAFPKGIALQMESK